MGVKPQKEYLYQSPPPPLLGKVMEEGADGMPEPGHGEGAVKLLASRDILPWMTCIHKSAIIMVP